MEFYQLLNTNREIRLKNQPPKPASKLNSLKTARNTKQATSSSKLVKNANASLSNIILQPALKRVGSAQINSSTSIVKNISQDYDLKHYQRQVRAENVVEQQKQKTYCLYTPIKQQIKEFKLEIPDWQELDENDLQRQLNSVSSDEITSSFITSLKYPTQDKAQVHSIDSDQLTLLDDLDDFLK